MVSNINLDPSKDLLVPEVVPWAQSCSSKKCPAAKGGITAEESVFIATA